MSVVDKFKNIFTKKPSESDLDSRLSLAMPEELSSAAGGETMQEEEVSPMGLKLGGAPMKEAVDELAAKPNTGDLVSIPGLGSRTVVQQQRVLFILLGAALLVLAGVTVYALNQSDRKSVV